ncbi:hypothetical protein F2P56_011525 [Juglans regia]|uniref:RNase H type-1 domain-containing protein n=2 Tax=Juglans regia TaxID=51240 RepID=A0A834CZQ6_JUGRE|nr:uncharacterized protein LOC109001042 [Juglans regia]KAF5471050.1 hypothetical protein F2P56_011525 [Juglans regia]
MVEDALCPIYVREVETVGHAIWSCGATSDVWAEGKSLAQKWCCNEEEFCVTWSRMVQQLNQRDIELVAVTMRYIWLRRNKVVFKEQFTGPKRVLSKAMEDIEVYREAQEISCGQRRSSGVMGNREVRWKKPGVDEVKVNWDAAFNLKTMKMGAGIVIRDEEGEVLVSLRMPKGNVCSPIVAEVHALW